MAETPLFPVEHGGQLRYVLEAGYNDGATINDADVRNLIGGGTFNSYKRTYRQRVSRGPKLSGVKPSAGSAMGEYAFRVEVDHKTISTPTLSATPSGVPECHWALLAGGWVATAAADADYSGVLPDAIVASAGNNDQILTYTYRPGSQQANSSLHLYYDYLDSAKTEGIRHEFKGGRHAWTLQTGEEGIFLDLQGKSLAVKPAKLSSPSTDDALTDITPAEPLGVNVSVTKLVATADTYGKSSETGTAASLTADVWGLVLTSNLEIAEKKAPHGTLGVARMLFNPGIPSLKLNLDQIQWSDDWDLYTFADERRAIRVSYAIPAPGSTTDFILLKGTFFIVDINLVEVGGYWSGELTLDHAHPDNSDGGGLDPSSDSLTLQWVSIVAAP